jgi:hypothetical protein
MTDQATQQAIRREIEHGLNEISVLMGEMRGQLTVLKGILMRTEARAQAFLAEIREWQRSHPDDDEPDTRSLEQTWH